MHQELIALVGALIEQNDTLMGNASLTDDDDEPQTYIDGTPIRTS